jgi:hypothetical protein
MMSMELLGFDDPHETSHNHKQLSPVSIIIPLQTTTATTHTQSFFIAQPRLLIDAPVYLPVSRVPKLLWSPP